jgi:hypothetical protein
VTHLLCSGPEEFNTSKYNQAIERGIPIVFEEFLIRLVEKLDSADAEDANHISRPSSPAIEDCNTSVKIEN